jgi:hypothetical protein
MMLKLIDAAQRILIRSENKHISSLYYKLAAMHFKRLHGKDLMEEVMEDSQIADEAADRHANMVADILFKSSLDIRKKIIRAAARGSFKKTIILSASV